MLETIAIILIVLWLLGVVSGYTLGNFIYVLLVVAIVLVPDAPHQRSTRRLTTNAQCVVTRSCPPVSGTRPPLAARILSVRRPIRGRGRMEDQLMGRKSSAKSSRGRPRPSRRPLAARSSTPLLVAALAVIVAIAVFAYTRSVRDVAATESGPTAAVAEHGCGPGCTGGSAQTAQAGEAAAASVPGLRAAAAAGSRSTAAYSFAAEHPEILSYVPCFCGCERAGHQGQRRLLREVRRDAPATSWNGSRTAWTAPCASTWRRDAQQMYSSGASVRDIRAAIEKKWSGAAARGTHTHTPEPPKSPP